MTKDGPLTNNFEVPNWAGKPPAGLHLDVLKDGKLIQKLMIDEKKCYFFGRNRQMCDFQIDHASCSRVHAALVWHKNLNRPFLFDLGSTHGTCIAHIRIDAKEPKCVPMDSELRFGASTRTYVIRERPQSMGPRSDVTSSTDDVEGGYLGLPESETELDNLTEFNTAHNRRVASINVPDVPKVSKRRKRSHISFKEDDEIINPEDIDPSIGRFRNLVHTMVIPTKRQKLATASGLLSQPTIATYTHHAQASDESSDSPLASGYSVAQSLGVPVPNLAPDVTKEPVLPKITLTLEHAAAPLPQPNDFKKRKYPVEAWPGKKPTVHALLPS